MLDILENLKQTAKKSPKRIIFPEGDDERVIRAAHTLLKEKLAEPMLVRRDALPGIECFSPETDKGMDDLIDSFYSANGKNTNPANRPPRLLSRLFFTRR